MKKLFFGAVMMLLMASCAEKGSSEKAREDSARIADSIVQAETAKAAAEQARLDSLRTDSIKHEEEKLFYNSLPNIKTLAVSDNKKETKYLHSLGFKGAFKEKGMEEDWRADGTFTLEEGQRKCIVKAHIDGYYQDYSITITGDDEAKEKYYNEIKKITRTTYGSPIRTKLKGNTIVVEIEDY